MQTEVLGNSLAFFPLSKSYSVSRFYFATDAKVPILVTRTPTPSESKKRLRFKLATKSISSEIAFTCGLKFSIVNYIYFQAMSFSLLCWISFNRALHCWYKYMNSLLLKKTKQHMVYAMFSTLNILKPVAFSSKTFPNLQHVTYTYPECLYYEGANNNYRLVHWQWLHHQCYTKIRLLCQVIQTTNGWICWQSNIDRPNMSNVSGGYELYCGNDL